MQILRQICCLIILACLSLPALASKITGTASVIDGDTLDIHGQRIRLHGIDAPESGQLCTDAAGKSYRCGQKAALWLSDLIGRQTVTCQQRDKDRYGRIVAACSISIGDIGSLMVKAGHALAYTKYSADYVAAQREAETARAGMWAGQFQPPWEWRRRPANENKPQPSQNANDPACGNKTYCREMSSCQEALFYLQKCGLTRLDGDGDGRPCEKLCR